MKNPGDRQGATDSEIARDGMQSSVAIEFVVLAGVEHVETCDPEGNGRGEQQDAEIERAAHGDPRGSWSDTQGKAQNEMRPARDALAVGVEQQDGEGYGGKN